MKSFMQIALATFGIMTLIFAGCAVPTPDTEEDTTEGDVIEVTPTEDDSEAGDEEDAS